MFGKETRKPYPKLDPENADWRARVLDLVLGKALQFFLPRAHPDLET